MGTDVDRVFAETERQTERLLAFLRLLVLFVLAFVFWFVGGWEQGQATMVPCRCWRWKVYGGLAKYLIHNRSFTGPQITEVWDLSDGCGGAA